MKEKTKFQIETIQRNKLIMAIEALVTIASIALGIYLVNRFLHHGEFQDALILSAGIFGILFALYVSIGNVRKHKKINELMEKV